MITLTVKISGDELNDMAYCWLNDVVFPSHTVSVERVSHAGGGSLSVDVSLLKVGAVTVALDSKAVHNAAEYYIRDCRALDRLQAVAGADVRHDGGEVEVSVAIEEAK